MSSKWDTQWSVITQEHRPLCHWTEEFSRQTTCQVHDFESVGCSFKYDEGLLLPLEVEWREHLLCDCLLEKTSCGTRQEHQ